MPLLDVSDVLLDPDFAQTISVIRRSESVNNFGRTDLTSTQTDGIIAVVTSGQSRLDRGADVDVSPNTIVVHTQFRLRGEAPGVKPDLVIWHGNRYLVNKANDWSDFGAGFIMAECSSIDFVDQAGS